MRFWIVIALALFAVACGSNEPYCGDYVDITGRAAAYCPGPRDDPVCDLPGQQAHFGDGTLGLELQGGARATCDADFHVACPTGTTGPAYCLRDPSL